METLATKLRLAKGLRWQSDRLQLADIADHLRTAAYVAGIVLAFGIVGSMDYADEQRSEAIRQAQAAERATYALAECMNGNAQFVAADGRSATLCMRAREVTN
jgi:hypothetical protein